MSENTASIDSNVFNWNSETSTFDGIIAGRYVNVTLSWSTGATFELAGLGLEIVPSGRR
jgi:hypothetical protein